MNTRGQHLLAEYIGCNVEVLDDLERIESLMNAAARAANTTVVASVFQPFKPQGVSGVVVIEESHLSIHTWPEFKYASVDFFTCGHGLPYCAHQLISKALKAERSELMLVDRGLSLSDGSMEVRYHRVENGQIASNPSEIADLSTLRVQH